MRYLELPYIEQASPWQTLLDTYRAEIEIEALTFSTRYPIISDASRGLSIAGTKKLMSTVLKDAGFSLRRDIPQGSAVFTRGLSARDVSIFCSLGDPLQMKRGLWSLGIGFCSSDDSFDEIKHDSILVVEGFAFWLPGGDWYLRHEGSPARIVLGIVVCAALLELLAREFDSA
jgi:hypothetical protein